MARYRRRRALRERKRGIRGPADVVRWGRDRGDPWLLLLLVLPASDQDLEPRRLLVRPARSGARAVSPDGRVRGAGMEAQVLPPLPRPLPHVSARDDTSDAPEAMMSEHRKKKEKVGPGLGVWPGRMDEFLPFVWQEHECCVLPGSNQRPLDVRTEILQSNALPTELRTLVKACRGMRFRR